LKVEREKAVGYGFLGVGVGMIFVSVFLMLSVFIGASVPPLLFHFSDVSFQVSEGSDPLFVVSGEDMNRMVAMGFWYILMFFIMWSGGRVASLGVNLIKETKVEAK
jgi:hypothetical protein